MTTLIRSYRTRKVSKKRPSKNSNILPLKFSKTDARYWSQRVFKNSYVENGERRLATAYSIKIQNKGQRETFPLHTANKTRAGEKARDIFVSLLANGWENTLNQFKPREQVEANNRPTVGDYITEVRSIFVGREVTLNEYVKAFRRIISDIFEISPNGKYNVRGGGSEAWQKKVDAIHLDEITSPMIRHWQARFINERSNDYQSKRKARVTVNTILRNAKGLFSKKILIALEGRMELPDPLPFSRVMMEQMPSMRYTSNIDAESLLRDAAKELGIPKKEDEESKDAWARHQRFKIFLLALRFGLRKSEIDTLMWDSFDFQKGYLSVQHSPYHTLKSEDSAGEIDLEPDMAAVFRHFEAEAKGQFVIESSTIPRSLNEKRTYRANLHFNNLIEWLRDKGVKADKPIHELRKEFGAIVCQRHGIYVASRALRHSDIGITAKHYLDRKEAISTGMSLDPRILSQGDNAA